MMDGGRIAISGSHGFIGKELSKALIAAGYELWPLVRERGQSPHEIYYDYHNKEIEEEKLRECYAVIHLAGKNVMSGLWTKKLRQEIYESRVVSTRFIAHKLSEMSDGPKVLLNASAIGIYGDRSDQKLDEEVRPGHGFLAKVCRDWERGTLFAKKAGIRVVNMRFGLVLDREGGMLARMLPMFKSGLGAVFGRGDQYISYVPREELVSQIIFALKNESVNGPVNMVSLEPVTNRDFAHALAKAVGRKTFLRIPGMALKLFGEQSGMALYSTRAYPKALLAQGYEFKLDHSIEAILAKVIGRQNAD